MSHLREQELILYFYREGTRRPAIEEHLNACPLCRERLAELRQSLQLLDAFQPPDIGEDHADQMWARLHPMLEHQNRPSWWSHLVSLRLPPLPRWSFAPAMLLLVLAALVAGRLLPRPAPASAEQARTSTEEAMRASMRQLIRQELSDEIQKALNLAQTQSTNALAALEARLMTASQAEGRELLQALSTILDRTREEDRAATLAMFKQLEDRHARGILDLRKDLEGLASATDDEIRQVRARWALLVAQASPNK